MFGKQKIAALVAEFLGTGILTLLVLSVQRSTIGVPFFVALGAGIALAVTVSALHETSGAHFNPALTIAMWTARKVSTVSAVLYIGMQLLGAWLSYYLYTYFVNNKLQSVGGHYTSRILIAEAVGTAIFAFGYASTVYKKYSTTTTAAFTGLSYMLGIIAASSAAIGLLNPALALGVRAWVWGSYVLGPVLGAVIGVNLYGLLFADSQTVNAVGAGVTAAEVVVVSETVSTSTARKPRAAAKRTTRATATRSTARKTTAKKTTARRTTRAR